jgi:hypothetical protein
MWSLRRDEDLNQLSRRINAHLQYDEDSNYRQIFLDISRHFQLRFPEEECPTLDPLVPDLLDEELDSIEQYSQASMSDDERSLEEIKEAVMRATMDSDLEMTEESTLEYSDTTFDQPEQKKVEEERPPLVRTNNFIDLTCYEKFDDEDYWTTETLSSSDDDDLPPKRFF